MKTLPSEMNFLHCFAFFYFLSHIFVITVADIDSGIPLFCRTTGALMQYRMQDMYSCTLSECDQTYSRQVVRHCLLD